MTQKDRISRRQFVAIAFVSILSPLVRRFPRTLAESAGRTACLSAVFAALPLALVAAAAWVLFRRQPEGTGFSDVMQRVLGASASRALTALYGLWLLFYAGFLLCSGAIRLVSALYLSAAPWVFVLFTALPCTVAALGQFRVIARMAMLLRPLMLCIPIAICLLTLGEFDGSLLLPVTADSLVPNACAALEIVNLISISAYLAFAGDRLEGRFRLRDWVPWAAALLGLLALMTAACIGMFGPELTAKLTFSFFLLARDVSALGSLERVEPLVVALWVFSDFILVSALLWIGAHNLRTALGFPDSAEDAPPRLTDLRRGRWLILLCAALSVAAALLIPTEVDGFACFSERLVPRLNAVFALALPLVILLLGLLRRKV